MREISLHILDIMQNSIAAGASRIIVSVDADNTSDMLAIRISDNGRGMDSEFVRRVLDPFVTTRTTRKVGLGIPMLSSAAELCGGGVSIETEAGKGTTLIARFGLHHIDRAPFGDIASTLINTIVAYPEISFRYEQKIDGKEFALDTDEVKAQLEDVPVNNPMVVQWMREYMQQGISQTGVIE